MLTTNGQSGAYRAILTRIAAQDDESGSPVDAQALKAAHPLTRAELAAVCDAHPQAITDEFSVNPHVLAAFFRGDIGALDLLHHITEAADSAAWEVIRQEVSDARAQWEVLKEVSATDHLAHESAESAHGVSGLFQLKQVNA